MAKNTTTTETSAPRRQHRTLEERIAELQAEQAKRAEKARVKAQAQYDEVLAKYQRAHERTAGFAAQLEKLADEHGFALPWASGDEPHTDDVPVADPSVAREA